MIFTRCHLFPSPQFFWHSTQYPLGTSLASWDMPGCDDVVWIYEAFWYKIKIMLSTAFMIIHVVRPIGINMNKPSTILNLNQFRQDWVVLRLSKITVFWRFRSLGHSVYHISLDVCYSLETGHYPSLSLYSRLHPLGARRDLTAKCESCAFW